MPSSASPPRIFDRDLLRRRLDRAAPGYAEADFLKRRAAGDIVMRLAAIMRDFPRAVDLGARNGTPVKQPQCAVGGKADSDMSERCGWPGGGVISTVNAKASLRSGSSRS